MWTLVGFSVLCKLMNALRVYKQYKILHDIILSSKYMKVTSDVSHLGVYGVLESYSNIYFASEGQSFFSPEVTVIFFFPFLCYENPNTAE